MLLAAIIVQCNKILSGGRNTKTSEKSGFAYAELNALLAAKLLLGRKPKGCILYSTLEPCAMCLGAITFSGIRKIVYGSSDPEGGAIAMFSNHPTYQNGCQRRLVVLCIGNAMLFSFYQHLMVKTQRAFSAEAPLSPTMGEERFILIGMSYNFRLLVVVHTENEGNIRIISAREATKKEKL